jgi:hypothetical protein
LEAEGFRGIWNGQRISKDQLFRRRQALRRDSGLGFSSGLPFLLVYSTQSAWLSEAGVPIETIGLLSELTIAYKFKFLWSPFLDKFDPPLLALFVGRRAHNGYQFDGLE